MTMLKVKLLTSLKAYSGGTASTRNKVYLKGAIFNGTLDTLPKEIVDAIKGKERYLSIQEVKDYKVKEVLPDNVSDPILSTESLVTDKIEGDEGESIGKEEKAVTEHSEDNLKEKIKKSSRKLKSKG